LAKTMKRRLKQMYWRMFTPQVEGVGIIEVILILVIVIGLVLIFKDEISAIVEQAFEAITGDSGEIIGGSEGP
jgi:hypothetical protein